MLGMLGRAVVVNWVAKLSQAGEEVSTGKGIASMAAGDIGDADDVTNADDGASGADMELVTGKDLQEELLMAK